jgi:ABC-2 type transport system ATP-binding protein
MRINLESAAIGEGLGASVPPLTAWIPDGEVSVLAVETAERPMLVSLLLGGRLKPDSGRVTVDGRENLDELRKRSALVDTPVVAEPTAGLSLASIVAEEFSFAGKPSSRRAVHQYLHRQGIAEYGAVPIRALPPIRRTRMFSELALMRPEVSALIVTSPERHGGDPAEWYDSLAEIAARGITIVIVTDAATRGLLLGYGARDALLPITPESESSVDEISTASTTSTSSAQASSATASSESQS